MFQAKITREDHRLGSWSRATRVPDPRLAPLLAREHIGVSHETTEFESWLEPPQPLATLIISLEDPLRTERGTLPQAWIAGLDDRPEVVATGGRHTELDLKLTAVGAHVLCGMPLHGLTGQIVPLDEVFGRGARTLAEQLSEASDWDRRFDLLERLLLGRLEAAAYPDPFVVEAVSRLRASEGRLRIGRLAADLRVSRRHLDDPVPCPDRAAAKDLRAAAPLRSGPPADRRAARELGRRRRPLRLCRPGASEPRVP